MPAMIAMGGLSLVGGFMASRRSAKEMKRMRQHLERQLKFDKKRWNHYRETYGGLEKQMVADAMYGTKGDYEGVTRRAAADVEGTFAQEAEDRRRRNMAYGLNPASGRFQSSDRRMGLQKAATSAMAQNTAREQERDEVQDETWNRRYRLGTFGVQMTDNAASRVGQSRRQIAQAHGKQADQYSQLANNLFAGGASMMTYGMMRGDGFGGGDTYSMDTGFNPSGDPTAGGRVNTNAVSTGGSNLSLPKPTPTNGVNMNAGLNAQRLTEGNPYFAPNPNVPTFRTSGLSMR